MIFIKRFSQSIAATSTILVFITIIQKALGFFREILFAHSFGLSSDYDLYLVAISLVFTLNTAVFYIIQHYFIPIYSDYKFKSDEYANNFFVSTTITIISISIIVLVLFFLTAKNIILLFIPVENDSILDKAIIIFKLYSLTIPFNAFISLTSAYHLSVSEYYYPSLIQAVINIIIILIILLFASSTNILILPIAFVMAYLTGAILMLARVIKHFKQVVLLKLFYWIKLDLKLNFILLVLIEIFSLSYSLVDRFFYVHLPSGSIAALSYSLNIFSIPIAIFSLPLLNIIFPKFSMARKNDRNYLDNLFHKSTYVSVLIYFPISAVLIYHSEYFVKILFERGEFSAADTLLTAKALSVYSYGLVFYSIYLLFVKLFYSFNHYAIVFYLSLGSILLKVVFNFILIQHLSYNGLALSTSLVYLILFLSGLLLANKKFISLRPTKFFGFLLINFINVFFIISILQVIQKVFSLFLFQTVFEIFFFFILYLTNVIILDFKYLSEIIPKLKIIRTLR